MRILLALILFAAPAYAQTTYTAANCERQSVADAIALSSNGDTVVIPAGTCDWQSGIAVTKAITIKGSGCTLDSNGRPTSCTTIIRDAPVANGNYRLFTFTLVTGLNTRLTGIEFRNNGRTSLADGNRAIIDVYGHLTDKTRTMRIDHCKFDHLKQMCILFAAAEGSVADHNTALYEPSYRFIGYIYGNPNASTDYGDTNWNRATGFGTNDFVFLEDNTLTYDDIGTHYGHTDSLGGGKYVVRYNNINRGHVTGHGTETGNRYRSVRAMEVYRNVFWTDVASGTTLWNIRGGAGVFHNNTVTGFGNALIQLNEDRSLFSTIDPNGQGYWLPWQGASGRNPWDINDGGNPHLTGTVGTWVEGTMTVTVSPDPGWSDDQWVGYIYKSTSGPVFSAIVQDSTSATLVLNKHTGTFGITAGETFELNKVTHNLDGVGRAGGTKIAIKITASPHVSNVGTTATVTVTGHEYPNGSWVMVSDVGPAASCGPFNGVFQITSVPDVNTFTYTMASTPTCTTPDQGNTINVPAAWNDQTTEPVYVWGNTNPGFTIDYSGAYGANSPSRLGTHFMAIDTPMPGYTEYTYPHPLNLAEATPGSDGISAPRNLSRVTARNRVRRVIR